MRAQSVFDNPHIPDVGPHDAEIPKHIYPDLFNPKMTNELVFKSTDASMMQQLR